MKRNEEESNCTFYGSCCPLNLNNILSCNNVVSDVSTGGGPGSDWDAVWSSGLSESSLCLGILQGSKSGQYLSEMTLQY